MQTCPQSSLSFSTVKKINSIIAIGLAALSLLLLNSCTQAPVAATNAPPPTFEVSEIHNASVTTYQEYPASIEGTVNVEVRPQVSGALDRVFVDEGALVHVGQPLFKINDQPYRAQLNNALASQHAAEAALINAQLEVDKLTPLVQNKVVSDYQLKAAKAAYQVAKANIEQAKANV